MNANGFALMSKGARNILLHVFIVVSFNAAHAENVTQPKEARITSHSEVADLAEAAGDYARTGHGIGALVIIGDNLINQDLSPKQAGQIVMGLLKEKGVTGKSFVGYNGSEGSAFTLFTRNNSFGPYNIEDLMKNIEVVSDEYKREKIVEEK